MQVSLQLVPILQQLCGCCQVGHSRQTGACMIAWFLPMLAAMSTSIPKFSTGELPCNTHTRQASLLKMLFCLTACEIYGLGIIYYFTFFPPLVPHSYPAYQVAYKLYKNLMVCETFHIIFTHAVHWFVCCHLSGQVCFGWFASVSNHPHITM